MTKKTITRANISQKISQKIGVSPDMGSKLLDEVLKEMGNGLEKDGHLKLELFGTFKIHNKKERVGRNPKTGEEAIISPRRTISFHAAARLKDHVLRNT